MMHVVEDDSSRRAGASFHLAFTVERRLYATGSSMSVSRTQWIINCDALQVQRLVEQTNDIPAGVRDLTAHIAERLATTADRLVVTVHRKEP